MVFGEWGRERVGLAAGIMTTAASQMVLRGGATATSVVQFLHSPARLSFLSTTTTTTTIPASTRTRIIPRTLRSHISHCYSTDSVAAQQHLQNNPTAEAADEKDDKEKEKEKEKKMIRDAAHSLDIRVGRILKAWRHEEADSLYVEEVDVGEAEPRTICSGLVNYIPLHLLQDRNVIVLANLKPRNMRGVKSNGMLMAASDAAHQNVELLLPPPEGSVPGQKVWFGSLEDQHNLPDAASPNQVQKKKIWELVQPHLKTDESCVATLGGLPMRTSAGVVVCESLKNANIS